MTRKHIKGRMTTSWLRRKISGVLIFYHIFSMGRPMPLKFYIKEEWDLSDVEKDRCMRSIERLTRIGRILQVSNGWYRFNFYPGMTLAKHEKSYFARATSVRDSSLNGIERTKHNNHSVTGRQENMKINIVK